MKHGGKILAVSAATILVGLLLPLEAAARSGQMFERLDTNGDGFIDRGEVEAAQADRFARADANSDGALSAEELATAHEARRGNRKGDHRGSRMTFDDLDSNQDGSISKEEFDAARSKRTERRHARMLERMDKNGDGMIQRDEMTGEWVERMFSRLDTDEDGRISKAEAEKARSWRRKHRAGD